MNKKAYKTIDGQAENLLVINKSKFLGFVANVTSVQAAKALLESLRKKHWEANHNCYAYIIGKNKEQMKASDDGEPSGTAGIPMLEVLKKQGLTDILVVATRYFGGIKLGAGGLVRAYSASASRTLKKAKIVNYVPCDIYTQAVEYDVWARIKPKIVAGGAIIFEQRYLEKVYLKVGLKQQHKDAVYTIFKQALKCDTILDYVTTDYVAQAVSEIDV